MMWMISPGIPKCSGRPSGTVEGAILNNSFVKQKQEVNSSTIKFNLKQVRGLSVLNPYHYATDASSLDGDIWSILHPPANWLVTKSLKLTVCYNGLHTHTHNCPNLGQRLLTSLSQNAKIWSWVNEQRYGPAEAAEFFRTSSCDDAPRSVQLGGGEEEGEVVPAMQRASRNPPKRGRERREEKEEKEEEEGVPSYELIIQGHTGGRKKERERKDKALPAMRLASRDAPKGGRGLQPRCLNG